MKIAPRNFFETRPRDTLPAIMALVLAVSALAWAWHVDMPAETGAHAQVSAADHAHFDNDVQVDRCDHCCHAGAHLVALVSWQDCLVSDAHASFTPAGDARPLPPQTDPPYIPPIA